MYGAQFRTSRSHLDLFFVNTPSVPAFAHIPVRSFGSPFAWMCVRYSLEINRHFMAKKESLTLKQSLYALHYATDANGNMTEAARLAGYAGDDATLAHVGWENYRKPKIRAEIERLLAERVMGPNEVLARMDDIIRGSLADFLHIDELGVARFDFKKAKQAGKLHLLKEYRVSENGVSIKLYNPQTELLNLAKHYGLLKDETTINVNIDITLINQVVEGLKATGVDPNDFFRKVYEKLGVDVGAGAE